MSPILVQSSKSGGPILFLLCSIDLAASVLVYSVHILFLILEMNLINLLGVIT